MSPLLCVKIWTDWESELVVSAFSFQLSTPPNNVLHRRWIKAQASHIALSEMLIIQGCRRLLESAQLWVYGVTECVWCWRWLKLLQGWNSWCNKGIALLLSSIRYAKGYKGKKTIFSNWTEIGTEFVTLSDGLVQMHLAKLICLKYFILNVSCQLPD